MIFALDFFFFSQSDDDEKTSFNFWKSSIHSPPSSFYFKIINKYMSF